MKVLLINSSPKPEGNTSIVLNTMADIFHENGIETEMVHIGNKDIRGCIACGYCKTHGKCVFNDLVNETAPLLEEADGVVVGSPVYYANANGTAHSFMQRLFYSTPFPKEMKVGASMVVARRGGASTAYDDLNKYFTISGMPVASSTYWNIAYGRNPGEVKEDTEGLNTAKNLARSMTFLMKSIKDGLEKYGMPEFPREMTNFIR